MAVSPTAPAAGFDNARFASEHGNVTETNPTALYFNPAGIAFSTGAHAMADGSLTMRVASWQHSQSPTDVPEPPGARGANYGTAEAVNFMGSPMAGLTFRLADFAFGAFYGAPFAGRTEWDPNAAFQYSTIVPGAVDSVARWHAIESNQTAAYFSAGAAYRMGAISVGVVANAIRSDFYLRRAKDPFAGDNDVTREGRWELGAGGWNGSFGAGVMVEAAPHRVWLGASYQARPGLGAMRLGGTLKTEYPLGSPPVTQNVYLQQSLPDIIRIGARFRAAASLELRLVGNVTRWSAMQNQCVSLQSSDCRVAADEVPVPGSGVLAYLRRDWRDTFGVHAGVSYWLQPETEAFAGVGFDTSAIPDATLEPGLRDADSVSLTAGGRVQVGDTLFVGGAATFIQYLDRDTTGKSELSAPTLAPTARRPDGGGKYSQWAVVPNLNIEKEF